MNEKAICRVMLFSYSGLEKRCKRIDRAIYNTAIHSACKDTWKTVKEIEWLTQEKIAYINTKVIIDQALAKLNKKYELIQHHIEGASVREIATSLGKNEIAIERRLCRQRERLYDLILKANRAEELLEIIYDSGWLMSIYKRELKRTPKIEP